MKESVRSLKMYFIVIGLLCLLPAYGLTVLASKAGDNIVLWLAAAVTFGIAVLYLYMAIRLKALLTDNPGLIKGVILAGAVLAVLDFLAHVVSVEHGPLDGTVISTAVALLVSWYLYANVSRLAAELAAED